METGSRLCYQDDDDDDDDDNDNDDDDDNDDFANNSDDVYAFITHENGYSVGLTWKTMNMVEKMIITLIMIMTMGTAHAKKNVFFRALPERGEATWIFWSFFTIFTKKEDQVAR